MPSACKPLAPMLESLPARVRTLAADGAALGPVVSCACRPLFGKVLCVPERSRLPLPRFGFYGSFTCSLQRGSWTRPPALGGLLPTRHGFCSLQMPAPSFDSQTFISSDQGLAKPWQVVFTAGQESHSLDTSTDSMPGECLAGQFLLAAFLFMIWGGLSFSDAQRLDLHSVVCDLAVRGRCWRSKSSPRGHVLGLPASRLSER